YTDPPSPSLHPLSLHDALPIFAGDRDGFRDRKAVLARQALAQRFALDIRHRIEQQPVRDTRVEQRQDVRMREPGGDLDFIEKPRSEEHTSELQSPYDLVCRLLL